MKRRLPSRIASFFAGLLAANLLAPAARAQVTAAAAPAPHYAEPQLDQLLGPIALYPDPLIALILPAATSPGDIVWRRRAIRTWPRISRGATASRDWRTTPW